MGCGRPRVLRALLLLGALLLPAMVPAAGTLDPNYPDVYLYAVTVDGQLAFGRIGYEFGSAPPLGLVVILHGYGHDGGSHVAHLQRIADAGYMGIAMDYRGTGFPLANGAADTRAAIAALNEIYDFPKRYLYSVSMGTAVAALVLPYERFDLWVDNEGLAMLHETWAGASALAPSGNPTAVSAQREIEAECGGTPATAPECYLARSAALHAGEFDLGGAILTHGLNDGLVPYDQGREMAAALRLSGVTTDFHTVVRSAPGTEGTTLTGYTPAGGMGLAGHGTESDDSHALTALSFALLDQVLAGSLAPTGAEHVHDGELGTLP